MKIILEFEKLRESCKYYNKSFDDNEGWVNACQNKSNREKGCSWGECKELKCPLIEKYFEEV